MRRLTAAAVALGVVASLMLPASPAFAADPLPPPVAELPDIPARVLRAITNSPIANQTFLMQQALIEFGKTAPKPPIGTVPLSTPKVITPPQALARGAGGVMTVAMLGWAITANGTISSLAALNGQDFENVYCSQPGWYQGVTMFVSFSIGPDCTSLIEGPNADKPATQVMSVGGFAPRNFVGPSPGFALYTSICGPANYNVPTGYLIAVRWMNGSAGTAQYVTSSGVLNANCGSTVPRMFATLSAPSGTSYPVVDWLELRTTGGAVVERSVLQQPNPTRRADCKMTAADGTVKSALGDFFNEADGIPISAEGMGCAQVYEDFVSEPGRGPGFVPDRIEVGSTDDLGTRTIVSDQETPDFSPSERESMVPNGNGQGLRLEKVIGSVVRNCMTWEVICADWWTDTTSGTNGSTAEGTYRCTYAGRVIELAECGVYRQTFQTPTATPTITDPTTGTQTPWVTGPATSSGTFPSTGTNPTPATSVATGGGGCTAGWSWNPTDWVLNPLRCAFIPSTAAVTATQTTLQNSWSNSTPGKLSTAVLAVGPALGALGNGDCGGLIVGVPVPDSGGAMTIENHAVLAACPGDFFADIAPVFYWFNTLTLAFGGFFAVRRMLDRLVGNS